MSHFIGGENIAPSAKIKGVATEIIPPNYTSMITKKGTNQSYMKNKHEAIEEARRLAEKFIEQENLLLSYENVKQQQKEFEELKRRLYRYGQSKVESSNLLKECSVRQEQIRLNLVDNNKKVYIEKKYNTQFSIRLHMVKRDQDISNEKKSLQEWNTRQRLAVTKSPNFRKMRFMLDRIESKAELQSPKKAEPNQYGYVPYLARRRNKPANMLKL